jgi:hypothetical protein
VQHGGLQLQGLFADDCQKGLNFIVRFYFLSNCIYVFRPNGIAVYNCCTGQKAPITWKEFVTQCFVSMRKHPLGDLMWYPDGRCRSSRLVNTFCSYTLHYFPAYLIDAVSWLTGKKPMYVSH